MPTFPTAAAGGDSDGARTMAPPPSRAVIFIPSLGEGGVDRMLVNIASGMAARGVPVDFVYATDGGRYLGQLDTAVNAVRLDGGDDLALTNQLTEFLGGRGPAVVVSAKGRDDRIALATRERLADPAIRFFLRVGTAVGNRAAGTITAPWSRWRERRRLRALYSRCDGILANAEAVADQLADAAAVPRQRIRVVPNPTVTAALHAAAAQMPAHPWLSQAGPPVILGIGNLRRNKDFATLIRAFARVRRERAARLLIFGRGRQQGSLARLAKRLGVAADVDLPGFTDNPYAALAHASVFVLSSRREGLPNVVIEAMAVGTPAVVTDCPGGVGEIVANGRYAPMVPPGDERAMAEAIVRVLDAPLPAGTLKEAAAPFTVEAASAAYIEALGLTGAAAPGSPRP